VSEQLIVPNGVGTAPATNGGRIVLRYAGAPERWLPIRYRAGEERNRINLSAILIHSVIVGFNP
jgi:hypothetical protein